MDVVVVLTTRSTEKVKGVKALSYAYSCIERFLPPWYFRSGGSLSPFIARGFGQHLGGALMVHGMGIMRRMVGGHVLNNARTGALEKRALQISIHLKYPFSCGFFFGPDFEYA